MQLHIEEISRCVARGAHAVVLLEHAGWQFLPANCLSNTVFDGIKHIIDAACSA